MTWWITVGKIRRFGISFRSHPQAWWNKHDTRITGLSVDTVSWMEVIRLHDPTLNPVILASRSFQDEIERISRNVVFAYNNTPRYNPKEVQNQFYITLIRADYVMWSLSKGFQRKCRNELRVSDPNSRTTTAINNTLVLCISRQTDSICCYRSFPATFCFSRHVTSCVSALACIISPRIRQVNFQKIVWPSRYWT
jgi:hypothetical protein